MYRWLILLWLFFSLTSCGFHLRGPISLDPPLDRLYLKTADPYGQLARNLRDYLAMSGTPFVDSESEASATLQILREDKTEQLINVSSTQQTRQYNLILTVTFQVLASSGKIILHPESLSETRAFTTLSDQILGGTNEQSLLIQQMREAIVYDIMDRLASRDVTHRLAGAQ